MLLQALVVGDTVAGGGVHERGHHPLSARRSSLWCDRALLVFAWAWRGCTTQSGGVNSSWRTAAAYLRPDASLCTPSPSYPAKGV